MTKFKHILFLFICTLILISCNIFSSKSIYAENSHWLSLPQSPDKNVDVFYVYPTVYTKVNDTDPLICELNNSMMIQGASVPFSRQATIFDSLANIYAPFYRQADAAGTLFLSSAQKDSLVGDIPYSSIKNAFRYYIKYLNNNRPFILAGHSQGSALLLFLLSDYMADHPAVYKRMIAAYVIGYSVTDTYLSDNPHLSFADSSNDIGVIISYNTEAPQIGEPGNPIVLEGANAINPINWRRDDTLAPASENLGSILWDSLGVISHVSHFADASLDLSRGVVITSTPDPNQLAPGNTVFGKGVYHRYDYAFFYENLRQNVKDRIAKYLNEH